MFKTVNNDNTALTPACEELHLLYEFKGFGFFIVPQV